MLFMIRFDVEPFTASSSCTRVDWLLRTHCMLCTIALTRSVTSSLRKGTQDWQLSHGVDPFLQRDGSNVSAKYSSSCTHLHQPRSRNTALFSRDFPGVPNNLFIFSHNYIYTSLYFPGSLMIVQVLYFFMSLYL